MDDLSHLVDVVQFGTRSPTIVGLFSEPLGANFDPTATGLAAAGPVGPLTQFAVRRTRDDARLFNVPCNQPIRMNSLVPVHVFAVLSLIKLTITDIQTPNINYNK